MAESIPELYFDEVESGATGTSPKVTVTSEMIMTYADLTGDHTPVHTDEEFARKSSFGQRVAHGLLGLSLTDGLKTQADLRFVPGMSLGWEWDFKLPIAIGGELFCRCTVESKGETSKGGWGIMRLASELVNQRGEVVQTGVHKLMIPMKSTAAA